VEIEAREDLLTPDIFKRRLSWDLYSSDPFDVTGPVTSDDDFFGRRNEALELIRQLERGRIRAFFGIRKIGKTSIINRAVQIAKKQHNLKIAMIDCSDDQLFSMRYDKVLDYVAKTIELAISGEGGYASSTQALTLLPTDLSLLFADLPVRLGSKPLAIIFDEIDYITPGSPQAMHWKEDFNPFWRAMRVQLQEAQRKGLIVSLLVSGVSSLWFKLETINSIENAALHFLPEEYLGPFPRKASTAMIRNLGKRCGLIFDETTASFLANECADFPYWIRKAASLIHRYIPVEERPKRLSIEDIEPVLSEFVLGEGGEIVSVALNHLSRAHPVCFNVLSRILKGEKIEGFELYTLEKYGLIQNKSGNVAIKCKLIEESLKRGSSIPEPKSIVEEPRLVTLLLDTSEWAEELALISRRRNILEKNLRDFIHYGLLFVRDEKLSWTEKILKSLPEFRRKEISLYTGEGMLQKLNFSELVQVILKNWTVFEYRFGDQDEYKANVAVINERPDAHAKEWDLADFARYRNSLEWLEKRTSN